MNLDDVHDYIDGMRIVDCAVHRKGYYLLLGIEEGDADPLEEKEAGVFVAKSKADGGFDWAYRGLGVCVGVQLCTTSVPAEHWLFVYIDGAVHVIGDGNEGSEDPIADTRRTNITDLCRLPSGHIIAAGTTRKVFHRRGPNVWDITTVGPDTERTAAIVRDQGFSAIDGFSESDLYACGGNGDLWNFDGSVWHQQHLPTNDRLTNILCAANGMVYVTMSSKSFLVGRGDVWRVVTQDLTSAHLEAICRYGEKTLVGTSSGLFEIVDEEFVASSIGKPNIPSTRVLASGHGELVAAGGRRAAVFDGAEWQTIIDAQ